MFDEITKINLLYDFYGKLLTKRQKEVMMLYYEENLSLSEIAIEFGISRQGVHDSLKNGEKALYEYERKLGLVEKFAKTQNAVKKIDETIEGIVKDIDSEDKIKIELLKIKAIIDNLDE